MFLLLQILPVALHVTQPLSTAEDNFYFFTFTSVSFYSSLFSPPPFCLPAATLIHTGEYEFAPYSYSPRYFINRCFMDLHQCFTYFGIYVYVIFCYGDNLRFFSCVFSKKKHQGFLADVVVDIVVILPIRFFPLLFSVSPQGAHVFCVSFCKDTLESCQGVSRKSWLWLANFFQCPTKLIS